MTCENCRRCEDRCKCCKNNRYKDECDLCGDEWDNFEPHKHFYFCPNMGLPLNKIVSNKPIVVTGRSPSTKKDMEEAISRFLKEHPYI